MAEINYEEKALLLRILSPNNFTRLADMRREPNEQQPDTRQTNSAQCCMRVGLEPSIENRLGLWAACRDHNNV